MAVLIGMACASKSLSSPAPILSPSTASSSLSLLKMVVFCMQRTEPTEFYSKMLKQRCIHRQADEMDVKLMLMKSDTPGHLLPGCTCNSHRLTFICSPRLLRVSGWGTFDDSHPGLWRMVRKDNRWLMHYLKMSLSWPPIAGSEVLSGSLLPIKCLCLLEKARCYSHFQSGSTFYFLCWMAFSGPPNLNLFLVPVHLPRCPRGFSPGTMSNPWPSSPAQLLPAGLGCPG